MLIVPCFVTLFLLLPHNVFSCLHGKWSSVYFCKFFSTFRTSFSIKIRSNAAQRSIFDQFSVQFQLKNATAAGGKMKLVQEEVMPELRLDDTHV
ncbi:hypothetical protein C8R41DRAFT_823201 [Lentinula lateritia]|uniref:Secreted protein n=1 Tax=Lentinula lateritia TaxID=40482 RepID=A0ABQ8VKZ3_9AGAR|nr:hypothetical protein C8R41DRAFT_823201 [Lentinula lateritia]